MNFNSLYQLFVLNRRNPFLLKEASHIAFMPDALSYLLTGEKVTEYTIASTSQMLNAFSKQWDEALLSQIGAKLSQFGPMVMPGTIIGKTSESVCRQTGLNLIPVVAVAGHDTASAVAAIPAESKNVAYLSSGTWSLMGVELNEPVINDDSYRLNFTNEGGVDGSIRFLKNICGMWLLEECRREWANTYDYSYPELIAEALKSSPFRSLINPDDASFISPKRMTQAIQSYCEKTGQPIPSTVGEFIRCIFESLALRYKQVFEDIQKLISFRPEKLHVIGGGSKNNVLNQYTANALGIPVLAGPGEATAIGNIMLQAKANGLVSGTDEMRKIIRQSFVPDSFFPEQTEDWNKAYAQFVKLTSNYTL